MKAYTTIDTCPAFNYLKCIETDDVRYIIKDVDIDNLPTITDDERKELSEILSQIDKECANVELKEHNRIRVIFDGKRRLQIKMLEYNQVGGLCNYLMMFGRDEFVINSFKKHGYTLTEAHDMEEVIRIRRSNENKKLQIAELEAEFESLSTNTNKGGAVNDFQKVALAIEKHLKRDIDLHNISIRKYILLKIETIKSIEEWHRNKK